MKNLLENENDLLDEIIFEDDKDAELQEDYVSNNPTALRLEIEKTY